MNEQRVALSDMASAQASATAASELNQGRDRTRCPTPEWPKSSSIGFWRALGSILLKKLLRLQSIPTESNQPEQITWPFAPRSLTQQP